MAYSPDAKLAWQKDRIAQYVGNGVLKNTANIQRFLAGKPMVPNKPAEPLSKTVDVVVTPNAKPKARRPKAIAPDVDSDCFSDLRWSNGTAYFTFARDGYQDSIDMDRAEFEAWASDPSPGGVYNALYRW